MTAADAGRLLRELREAAGLTVADLAEASGRTPGWLRQLERGKPTRASTLVQVATALARRRDLDVEATDVLVHQLLTAADGDHLAEAKPGTPRRAPNPERHRRQVDEERRCERRAEVDRFRDDPEAFATWVRARLTPDAPWDRAADLLDPQDKAHPDRTAGHERGGDDG